MKVRPAGLAAMVGAALIYVGVWISIAKPFGIYHLVGQNPAWAFGPRELAHALGYAGCSLGGWALVRSFSTARGRRANLLTAFAGVLSFPVFLAGPDWIVEILGPGVRMLICTRVIPLYFLGTLALLQFAKDLPAMTRPVPAAVFTGVMLSLWSVLWEIEIQPLETVYGAGPRGYIQWAQVACDWMGIWLPGVVLGLSHHRTVTSNTSSRSKKPRVGFELDEGDSGLL